ncbi:hypothetical protein ABFO81_13040 [Acinetobacter baumannii]
MDKPMTFIEWMGKQGNLALVHANCCRIAYEAGQQSQQAKVEELETLYTQQGINMLKMQKRVDAAQKLIDDWNCGGVHIFDLLDELEQALKGEGQ